MLSRPDWERGKRERLERLDREIAIVEERISGLNTRGGNVDDAEDELALLNEEREGVECETFTAAKADYEAGKADYEYDRWKDREIDREIDEAAVR